MMVVVVVVTVLLLPCVEAQASVFLLSLCFDCSSSGLCLCFVPLWLLSFWSVLLLFLFSLPLICSPMFSFASLSFLFSSISPFYHFCSPSFPSFIFCFFVLAVLFFFSRSISHDLSLFFSVFALYFSSLSLLYSSFNLLSSLSLLCASQYYRQRERDSPCPVQSWDRVGWLGRPLYSHPRAARRA